MRDGEHVIRRGKYVSTVGMYIFLYIVMPYIMLAIYFVRVLGIFPTNPNENTVAFFSLPGRVEEQRQHIEERKQLIKERRSQHKARRSAIYNNLHLSNNQSGRYLHYLYNTIVWMTLKNWQVSEIEVLLLRQSLIKRKGKS